MPKLKIGKINVKTTKKDGSPLVTKKGDQMWAVSIQPEGSKEWIGGLVFQAPSWNVGDELDVELYQEDYQGKTYTKFRLPKKGAANMGPINDKLDLIIKMLESLLSRSEGSDKEISVDDDLSPDEDMPF